MCEMIFRIIKNDNAVRNSNLDLLIQWEIYINLCQTKPAFFVTLMIYYKIFWDKLPFLVSYAKNFFIAIEYDIL